MNWKEMTIKKKISLGFGIVLILLAVVGVLSFAGVSGIVRNAGQVIDGNKLDGNLAQKEVDHLNWVGKVNALLTDDNVTTLEIETNDHKCGFGKWLYGQGRKEAVALVPSLAPLLKQIEEPHRHLHESAIEIKKVFKQADQNLPVMFAMREIDHLKWASQVRDALLRKQDDLNVQTDPHKCALGEYLNTQFAQRVYENGNARFKKIWNQMVHEHTALHGSAAEIQKALKVSQAKAHKVFETKTMPILARTLKSLEDLKNESEHELHGMHEAKKIYSIQTIPALLKVQQLLEETRAEARKNIMTDEAMLDYAQATKRSVTIVGMLAIVIGIALAFFIARAISVILQRIANQMDEGAIQVASAASQVSSSSQCLAEGASEQAASIEQTSSSLEQMSSMTKSNAGNASQADSLMKQANDVVAQANNSMDELTTSMEDISKASEETSKIIKTIDEIAFQTNLLALNAAVEAARAGEAGAGFAVVADEVRNLAMRAADAAKNTAQLIEGTVKKVGDGTGIVNRTNEAFTKVAKSSAKVGELVGEIAAASNEQAQGIGQVNIAVSEMDKITQQNAANAEESASAAEEMSAQAEHMKGLVGDLLQLIGTDKNDLALSGHSLKNKAAYQEKEHALLSNQQKAAMPVAAPLKPDKIVPDKVIPLDKADFIDF
ncbi:MAG: methyl-accepting chemotaxis protein [Desulfobacteraceae bacterium]|nr:methyl-accepting chemotaxis protein [Desulfobacteraceae bacterium]